MQRKRNISLALSSKLTPMSELVRSTLRPSRPDQHDTVAVELAIQDLSWLAASDHALQEAGAPVVPLVDRLAIQSLVANTLDELFTVRFGLLQVSTARPGDNGHAAAAPLATLLDEIRARARATVHLLYETWRRHIEPLLVCSCSIALLPPAQLSRQQRAELGERFAREVWPVLTPIAVDQGHPFPNLRNRGLNLAVALNREDHRVARRSKVFVVVAIPSGLDRLVKVGLADTGEASFILLEELIAMQVGRMFPGFRLTSCSPFRVTRACAPTTWRDAADERIKSIPENPCSFARDRVVRLELAKGSPTHVETFLGISLGLDPADIYRVDGPLDLHGLCDRCSRDRRGALATLPPPRTSSMADSFPRIQ